MFRLASVPVVFLFALGLFGAGASAQDAGPTITVGDLVVSGAVCPDSATVTVPFKAEAADGISGVFIDGRSENFPFYLLWENFYSGTQTVIEGEGGFELPPNSEPATWEVVVTVVDSQGASAQVTTSFDVPANPGCAEGNPTFSVSEPTVSGPVCPDSATVSAEVTIENVTSDYLVGAAVFPADDTAQSFYQGDVSGLVRDGDRVSGPVIVELPASAEPGTWQLRVGGTVGTEYGPYPLEFLGSFDLEAESADCADKAPPEVSIVSIDVSGPVCPETATLTATITASDDSGLVGLDIDGSLGINAYIDGSVDVAGTEVTEDIVVSIPPDQPPGKYLFRARAYDENGRFSVSEPLAVTIERSPDCDIKDTTVTIDELKVCPADGFISVTYTAVASGDGIDGISALSSMSQSSEQTYSVELNSVASHTDSFTLPIPPPEDREPGPLYEVIVSASSFVDVGGGFIEFVDTTAVEYFELDGRDDCNAVEPEVTPTPTTPSSTPTPVATPTPKPIVYWEDGYSPNGFVGGATTPPKGVDPTATAAPKADDAVPGKPTPPTKIAFTGASTTATAFAGAAFVMLGFGMFVIGRGGMRRSDR